MMTYQIKNHYFALFILLSNFTCFSQQRIGFEVSSRIQDLSCGFTFQKAVGNHFLYGTGLLLNGTALGYRNYDSGENTHNPYAFIPSSFMRDTNEYYIESYASKSGLALGIQLMTGFFHEFNSYHGLRINLNYRFSVVRSTVSAYYFSNTKPVYLSEHRQGWHSVQALSPEIYHTLRQSNKWTLYYGIRLPIYMSIFEKSYSPAYKTDMYNSVKLEVAVGITRHIGKSGPEKSVP